MTTYTPTEIKTTIKRLTPAHLKEARAGAISMTLGEEPKLKDFQHGKETRAQKWKNTGIGIALVVIFFSAVAISGPKIYSAGSELNWESSRNAILSVLAGVGMLLMSEATSVVSIMAARSWFKDTGWQWLLYAIAFISFCIAIAGNIIVTGPIMVWPHELPENTNVFIWLFGWLETIAPPLFVLIFALLLEKLLDKIEEQDITVSVALKAALTTWKEQTARPESLPGFQVNLEQEIKDALVTLNSQRGGGGIGKRRRELVATMSHEDWRIAVRRDLPASMITEESSPAVSPKSQAGSAFSQPASPLLLPTSEQK